MDPPASSESVWNRHARRTALRLSAGWWLQMFAPLAAALALLAMGLVLWLRSRGELLPFWPVTGFLGAAWLITALACWMAARRRFPQEGAGLVLLESRLKMNNALSAARQGVTEWPTPPERVDDGFRFRAPWLCAPLLLTVSCLAAAFLLPVELAEARAKLPPPLALTRAEEILNTLQAEDVANPEAMEKAREQLEALMGQDPDNLYSHHGLEAADALETALSEAAGAMGSHLETAAQAADSLEKYDSSLSPSARQQLESDLQSALEGLRNSSLGTSAEMQKLLSKLDPAKLKELDPEQLQKMLQNLKAKSEACRNCKGGQGAAGAGEAEQALQDLLNGEDRDGDGPGRGGVNRGPGTADLAFEKNASDLGTNQLEQLESGDLSRTLPGDHLGTRDMEHQLDKTETLPFAGGDVAVPAAGGDAVWRGHLMPSEQKVLRRYFK